MRGVKLNLSSEEKKIRLAGQKRRWKEQNRHKKKEYDLRVRYNLSIEEYTLLFKLQDSKCALCSRTDRKLCVDHCHKTGKVRGLLCRACNASLGQFNDDIDFLYKVIDYLK